jgi:predicted ATPase/DNA-binding SARP family transcriptional activator
MDTGRPQRKRPRQRNDGAVQLRLLGPPELLVAGEPRRFASRKTLALLTVLAVERSAQGRDKLASWLWPDSNEPTARSALRNALSELRAVVGQALVADRQTATLDSDHPGLELDLTVVAAALAAPSLPRLQAAAALVRGELLASFPIDAGSELDDWLSRQRAVWQRRVTELYERLADQQADAGQLTAAIETAERRLGHDPLSESAHRQLMSLLFRAGDRESALRTYESCRALLKRELGTRPTEATEALARTLLHDPSPPSGSPATAPDPEAGPTRTATPARPGALPIQPAPLLGREQDVRAARAVLDRGDVQLLTLSGPGGVGKTRLALELASQAAVDFPDGARFVALAAVRDPTLVAPTVARALGLTEQKESTPLAELAAHLADRRMLLVLDNFEQVADAALTLAELAGCCPGLKLLVTSRVVLRLRGEHVFAVSPLAVPGAGPVSPDSPSVRLFLERAHAVRPALQPTPEELAAVGEICTRLDGLPLAIELAAARVRALAPSALLARLGQRLPVLTGGPRDLPARQQGLRDTLRWSHELLGAGEQRAFRRLAVFAGGFTLAAAEAVIDPAGGDALDRLGALIDHSLVSPPAPDGRYQMLETIREFAAGELEGSGERETSERAHAAFFLGLVERAGARIRGSEQEGALAELAADHHNLRSALQVSLTSTARQDRERGLRLAAELAWYWHFRGHWREGRDLLARALQAAPDAPPEARGRALCGAGLLACAQEDFEAARGLLDAGLELLPARAAPFDRAHALGFRAAAGIYARQVQGLEPILDESLALFRACDSDFGIALTLLRRGLVALIAGDWETSERDCRASLDAFRALGNAWGVAMALANLGEVHLGRGDAAGAVQAYRDSLEPLERIGSAWYLALNAQGLAGALAARGDAVPAARLLAAAQASRRSHRSALPPMDRHIFDRCLASLRAQLPPPTFDQAWAAGESLPLSEAIREARLLP